MKHPGERVAKTMRDLHEKSMHWMRPPYSLEEDAFFARWAKEYKEFTEHRRAYFANYSLRNREKMNAYSRAYLKKWRAENINVARARSRKFYSDNKEKCRQIARDYRAKVKADPIAHAKYNEKMKLKARRKVATDPQFRLKKLLRTRIWMAVHCAYGKKAAGTFALLGCTRERFVKHIQSTFQPGMTWDNYGKHGWHIDHKVPLALFDLTKPDEQFKAFHFTNTQAMWWKDNLCKGSTGERQTEMEIV